MFKAIFNPYKPAPIHLEYPEEPKPEPEQYQMPEDDAYALFEKIVDQLMPEECPVAFVVEDGTRCLCNQFEMISYETEILELAEAQMPESGRYIFGWLKTLDLSINDHQQRMDEIMEQAWERYNLTW